MYVNLLVFLFRFFVWYLIISLTLCTLIFGWIGWRRRER